MNPPGFSSRPCVINCLFPFCLPKQARRSPFVRANYLSLFFLNLFFFNIYHLFIIMILLYNVVSVLLYINMNPPQVYTYSPSWTPLPPPCTIPLGHPSATALSILYRTSNLDWQFISYMILYMFQCHSPKSSHPLPLPQSPSKRDAELWFLSHSIIIISCNF